LQECFTVAFGNVHQGADRQLLAGYCNGDLRLFDLRTGTQRWSTNLGSGVTSVDFDRPDIDMNKFVAVCMKSTLHAVDARTLHSTKVCLLGDQGKCCI
jgi:outer membrane protein assembly factor BamB